MSLRGEDEGCDRTIAGANGVVDGSCRTSIPRVLRVPLFTDRMEVDDEFAFLPDIKVQPPTAWLALQQPNVFVLLHDQPLATAILQLSQCIWPTDPLDDFHLRE